MLAPEHEELSPIFAGKGDLPMPQRFALAKWLRLTTGAPVLELSLIHIYHAGRQQLH